MIKRVLPFIIFLILINSSNLVSQSRTSNRINFREAESWILFEDYREALPIYQELLKLYPDNSNFKYRIGQCYLNLPGEKEKAIAYLEEAADNINPDYKEKNFREKGAPWDALYYLANAYRINLQLDKAIETYRLFMEKLDPRIYDSAIVAFQIRSCENAKVLMASPVFIKEENLGRVINDDNSEFNPVVSADETLLVFSRRLPFYDAIMYSVRENGSWTEPRNMNEILKIDRNIYPSSVSSDGKVLYLYNSDNYDGNIYTSTYENGTWGPAVKLNDNINTKYWESHAAVSHDNKKLFFTSNRKGGYGGLDIYVSDRDSTGDWGPAVNLGPVINTRFNEETPFLSRDGKTLFFSSSGHHNMGGYDIFYSSLLGNGEWSVPLNAGYPLNTTDDDLFFMPLNQGYEGYYSRTGPQGYGGQDIYRVEIFSDKHPRKFRVSGMAKIDGPDMRPANKIRISSFNIRNPEEISEGLANPETGSYELTVNHGDHTLIYETNGREALRKNIHLPLASKSDSFILPPAILPLAGSRAILGSRMESNINAYERDSILIPLKTEPKSRLVAEHWHGDSLLHTRRFNIDDSVFNLKISPRRGGNRILLTLSNQYGNTAEKEFFITAEKKEERAWIRRPEHPEILAERRAEAISRMEGKIRTVPAETSENLEGDPDSTSGTVPQEKKSCRLWYLWIIAGAGIAWFVLVYYKKRKNKNEG
ncbi:MAG TPA: tetratricopeptide repeat protein [Bacteroidales bacterium]|jgi:tetratricopeptide (TPR) repeat protein|nr:tetratricopeptide repeat protein [Bacteroidales bacterium]HOS71601.1 tetratricopeptide repeat protein [Bacteroidales bacterium]HQH24952.1 tetratricopeptide repeat protein [Bacteroidales bacterium]HQJ82356.1 tetratricopeptide repeat protein [Bacteroidales bacterium]